MKRTVEHIRGEIYSRPGLSRGDLLEITGFDPRTIAKGVKRLLGQGMIRAEQAASGSRSGRPCELYYPDINKNYRVAGIYLDINSIVCVLRDVDGGLGSYYSEPFVLDMTTMTHAARRAGQVLEKVAAENGVKLSAVGLTLRDRREPRFLAGVERLLARLLGVPVYGGNPIDAFAWAARGRHADGGRVAMAHFHYEIELCVIDGFSELEDGHAFSRELLHEQVNPGGPPCSCGGNGCMEYYIHEYSMAQEFCHRRQLAPWENVRLHELYQDGDPVARELVDEGDRCVGLALRKVVERYEPDTLILLTLVSDQVIRCMNGVLAGAWMPDSARGKTVFIVQDEPGDPGHACAAATAEKAAVRQKWGHYARR